MNKKMLFIVVTVIVLFVGIVLLANVLISEKIEKAGKTNELEEVYKVENKDILGITDFYNHSIIEDYKDIRKLEKDYSIE